jgi:hypothetical protein
MKRVKRKLRSVKLVKPLLNTERRVRARVVFVFVIVSCFNLNVFAVNSELEANRGVIPEGLLRPQRGEAVRYPRDIVIGELGIGSAPPVAYRAVRRALANLFSNSMETLVLSTLSDEIKADIAARLSETAPYKYRIGGGRVEIDGSVSFLFRYIGSGRELDGEIYLREMKNDETFTTIMSFTPRPDAAGGEVTGTGAGASEAPPLSAALTGTSAGAAMVSGTAQIPEIIAGTSFVVAGTSAMVAAAESTPVPAVVETSGTSGTVAVKTEAETEVEAEGALVWRVDDIQFVDAEILTAINEDKSRVYVPYERFF